MRVAIVGCGYVGLELGRQLHPEHEVYGVRRSAAGRSAVEEVGLRPVQADATDGASLSAIPTVDAVVYSVSAGGRDAGAARSAYMAGQRTVIETLGARERPPERYVYTSSTGVYGDHGGEWVDEETPLSPAGPRAEALVEAERVALESAAEQGMAATVARFGGLYGPDRYRLERYLEGPVTEGYRNLCHRDDAAGAVGHLLEGDRAIGEVVNVVDDEPVPKWDFADWLAAECGLEAPPKQTLEERLAAADLSPDRARRIRAQKRCSNDKLRALGYEFTYATYHEGYRDAVEDWLANRE